MHRRSKAMQTERKISPQQTGIILHNTALLQGAPKTQKIRLLNFRKFALLSLSFCHATFRGVDENYNVCAQLRSLLYAKTLKVCRKWYAIAIYWL